jgi:hypothetical protein
MQVRTRIRGGSWHGADTGEPSSFTSFPRGSLTGWSPNRTQGHRLYFALWGLADFKVGPVKLPTWTKATVHNDIIKLSSVQESNSDTTDCLE